MPETSWCCCLALCRLPDQLPWSPANQFHSHKDIADQLASICQGTRVPGHHDKTDTNLTSRFQDFISFMWEESLTFFSTTNSFSAVVLMATSSSYLGRDSTDGKALEEEGFGLAREPWGFKTPWFYPSLAACFGKRGLASLNFYFSVTRNTPRRQGT